MKSLFFFALLFSLQGHSKATKVCYGKYGCFSNDPPFDKSMILLPSDPDSIGTRFLLHTRTNTQKNVVEILNTDNNASIVNSTFDPLLKVKFIVHGYTQNGESAWVKEMAVELLKKEKMNVIVVDWGLGSSVLNLYDVAAGNTRLVGAQVAELIDVLHRKFHVPLTKFHIIGHSLGAQTAGFAGERLVKSGKVIGRITGLDPARPGFDFDDGRTRLDPTDALFVDVIHSDVKNGAIDSSLGLQRPCGHVDYYPKGGKEQPGCATSHVVGGAVNSFLDHGQVSLPWMIACNHMKSVAYFIASIHSSCAMKAFPCGNWEDFQDGKCFLCHGKCSQMGYNADQYRGSRPVLAFLKTVKQEPFCVGDNYYRVVLHSKAGSNLFSISSIIHDKISVKLIGSKGTVETVRPRSVKHGKDSFLLSSARDIGKLQSVEVQLNGYASFLKKVVVHSKATNKRYTACFRKQLGSYFSYLISSNYTQAFVEGRHRRC
ncbi:pancreatic lipase-related protein 2-like isoform X1 [Stylophora pistillata]|uniref:Pancreatic lipase-related protein 2 n=1 Tax=Stylophora pistillata TaxID=50429 RepID=A0A2B4SUR2_STYPI|nr:pancreatic lipase-related protein 2-like isoform X1 [Stylophora pistillata]PFX32145.1 Pancreatic lipase-related protein 2 [Stylophora pistillata]